MKKKFILSLFHHFSTRNYFQVPALKGHRMGFYYIGHDHGTGALIHYKLKHIFHFFGYFTELMINHYFMYTSNIHIWNTGKSLLVT